MSESNSTSRRQFIKGSAATAVAVSTLAASSPVHAAGSDILKVGLIGCGGRGSGAANNAMRAEDNVRLTAMCDLFPDRLETSKRNLQKAIGAKYDVKDDQCFSGFDGYKQLLATDVDVVLLCTPPHFRPMQLKAAIEAGKHVFCEKPVAVDGPGCRKVAEATALAKEKDLSIVSGLCWRYDLGVSETAKRIQDGAIGDIITIQPNYLTGTLWHRGRKPEWSEMEYQLRNWLYFTWLSGDHIVEQHIHSLDKAVWLNGDQAPVKCYGLGGRQVRTDEKFGNIYDHHAVVYEFPNGTRTYSYTRQQAGVFNNVDDYVFGTKGTAQMLRCSISGENEWRYRNKSKPSMYDVEHKHLFAGIRSGKHINNGDYMMKSTLMAIMGRMACYTGQTITSEAALASTEDLSPKAYEFGDVPVPAVAIPGFTKFT